MTRWVRGPSAVLTTCILQGAWRARAAFAVDCWVNEATDYTGGDLRSVGAGSQDECCQKCAEDEQCAVAVFYGSACYLKGQESAGGAYPVQERTALVPKFHMSSSPGGGGSPPSRDGAAPPPPPAGGQQRFDCDGDITNWQHAWSDKQKDWCCANEKRACASGTESPVLGQKEKPAESAPKAASESGCDEFCEHEGVSAVCRRRIQWAVDDKFRGQQHSCISALKYVIDYCGVCSGCTLADSNCQEKSDIVPSSSTTTAELHKAPTATPTATPTAMQTSPPTSSPTNSPTPAPTPENVPSTTTPFDCQDGFHQWEKGWSDAKKAWCCEKYSVACVSNFSLPFDCEAGVGNWEKGWSVDKKIWCCRNHNKGCLFDCKLDVDKWEKGWSQDKKSWCCENRDVACPFDCAAGLDNWKAGWAVDKKQWCCKFKRLGCEITTGAPSTATAAPTSTGQPAGGQQQGDDSGAEPDASEECSDHDVAISKAAETIGHDIESCADAAKYCQDPKYGAAIKRLCCATCAEGDEAAGQAADGAAGADDDAAGGAGGCAFEESTDYGGVELASADAESKEDCCRACGDQSECTVGVFFEGTCYLKNAALSDKVAESEGRTACLPDGRLQGALDAEGGASQASESSEGALPDVADIPPPPPPRIPEAPDHVDEEDLLLFNCDDDSSPSTWPKQQKDFCCTNEGVGCSATAAVLGASAALGASAVGQESSSQQSRVRGLASTALGVASLTTVLLGIGCFLRRGSQMLQEDPCWMPRWPAARGAGDARFCAGSFIGSDKASDGYTELRPANAAASLVLSEACQ